MNVFDFPPLLWLKPRYYVLFRRRAEGDPYSLVHRIVRVRAWKGWMSPTLARKVVGPGWTLVDYRRRAEELKF